MDAYLPVVVGNLMMGRCFSLANLPFIGVTSSNDPRIHFSKQCKYRYSISNPSKDTERFYQELVDIASQHPGVHPLIYTNDGQLQAILNHYDEIHQKFKVALPEKRILEASLNKEKFIDLAREYDIPIPPTARNCDQLRPEQFRFPVVLKPLNRAAWFASPLNKEFKINDYSKVIYIDSPKTFEYIVNKCLEDGIQFVVQQFLFGPEANIISFHSFYTEDHQPLGYYVGRKIRTLPRKFGLSCALQLVDYPEIVSRSLKIMETLKFVGPIKIDYKLDEKSGQLYVLELNTRFNMWHYLGARAGINLPLLACQYLNGTPVSPPLTTYRTDVKWFSFFQDVSSFREYRQHNEMSVLSWLKSYKGYRLYQTLAWDDPKPVIYAAIQTVKGALRRLLRIFK